ncbi:MAG: MFS transporter [Acidimicrobiales bacterium]
MATQQASDEDGVGMAHGLEPLRLDGPAGWRVAFATFLATFTVFGVSYSFGSFFGPMADEFGSDRGSTALFFAITTFLYFALGVVTGHLADRHGPRPLLLVGGAFLVAGLLATSQVSSIWLGYLTYGIGVGIGVACVYVPMVAAVGGWFDRQRTTALGFAVAGIGVGTLTIAPLSEWLIDRYGWRTSYVVLAIGAAGLLAIASIWAAKPPLDQGASEMPATLGRVVRERSEFWILYGAMALVSVALFVPFVFLPDYLDTEGISGPAGWLIGLIGISSVVGRLGLGALAARFSSMRLYVGSFLVLSLSFSIWIFAGQSYVALLVFAVVLGVAYGGFIALSPAVTAEVFGPVGLGAVLGALYTAAGIGGLVGPPLMGWLIDAQGYRTALLVATFFALASTALLSRLRPPARSG